MIKPEERLFTESRGYFGDDPDAPVYCNVFDWDQLRLIKIWGTFKLFPPEEDVGIQVLAQFIDHLSPEVRAVTVNKDGLLSGVSTDPSEDETGFIGYIPFSAAISLSECRTVNYSKLQELDRLGPGVDLSSYHDEAGTVQKVAFKFNPMAKVRREVMLWEELHVLHSIPAHSNILGLNHVVLEDVESRIIGFTTKYIPGGTLEAQPQAPFRLEWLKQLTEVVDYLNLELGLMHQDVAPRNLLVDPETQKLLLFDFNWAARGNRGLLDGRDDVTGVVFTMYEIITNDTHFTEIPHDERTMDTVQNISHWACNRELDSEVSVFRGFLNAWVARRKSPESVNTYFNPPRPITWPDLPTPPDYAVPFEHGTLANGEPNWVTGGRSRKTALKLGQYCFRWDRPPQSRALKVDEEVSTSIVSSKPL